MSNAVEVKKENGLEKFDKLAADVRQYSGQLMAIKVTDMASKDVAYAGGKTAADYRKKIDAVQKSITKPLKDFCKQVEAHAKKLQEPLDKADTHLRDQLIAFEKQLEKIRQEEFKKAEEIRKDAEAAAAAEIAEKQKAADLAAMFAESPEENEQAEIILEVEKERIQTDIAVNHQQNVTNINSMKVGGTSRPWTFEVTDEAKLPIQFMSRDDKKIREHIKNCQADGSIAEWAADKDGQLASWGIRFFQDTRVAFR